MAESVETRRMIRRRVLSLSLPYIVQSLSDTMMFYVDMLMVGYVGTAAIAAMAIAGPISYTLSVVLNALGVGTVATVGHAVGSGDEEAKQRTAATALMAAVLLGVMGSAIGFTLLPQAAYLFAPPDNPGLADDGAAYIALTGGAVFFYLVQIVCARIMIAAGNSKLPMAIGVAQNVVNVLLNWVFIFGRFGFPAMGVRGAALATAMGHVFYAGVAGAVLFSKWSPLRLRWGSLVCVTRESLRTLMKITLPACVEPLVLQTGFLIYAKIITLLGAAQLAAHRVAITIESLTFMPGNAIAVACSALVAQSLGAKWPDHAARSVHEASRLSLYFMSGIGVLFLVAPELFTRVFSPKDETTAYLAAMLIAVSAFEQPFFSQAMTLAGALRGAGDTKSPVAVAFIGVWLIRIPMAYVLAISAGLGVVGIWLTMIADWFVRMVVFLVIFKRDKWREIRP